MEKELTNEETAKVIAIYWESNIEFNRRTCEGGWMRATDKVNILYPLHLVQLEGKLHLTHLSKISDEDAIEVAKFSGYSTNNSNKMMIQYGKSMCHSLMNWETREYLIWAQYAVPLFFAPNHWANGKNAIELGIAKEVINKRLTK